MKCCKAAIQKNCCSNKKEKKCNCEVREINPTDVQSKIFLPTNQSKTLNKIVHYNFEVEYFKPLNPCIDNSDYSPPLISPPLYLLYNVFRI